jgi:iron complex outermembrane receptor protein
MLRAYIDHTRRDTPRFDVRRNTADVEYRRWLAWGERNNLIAGVQADWTSDDVGGPGVILQPPSRAWTTFNAFVQNTTQLVPDTLFLMLGTKFTQHSFIGFQTQPSVRLWWTPSERQIWWAAVSRPVRVPSRFEENGLLVVSYVDRGRVTTGVPDGDIVPVGLAGDSDLRPEKLLAWEVGHRLQASDRWAFDTTLFYNHYQRLLGIPPSIVGVFTDASSGATWGGDISASGVLNDRWRVEASYSHLHTRIDGNVFKYEETSTPSTQAQLRSYFDATDDIQINGGLYYVSRIAGTGALALDVPAYTRADLGVTWRPRPGLSLSLWGQNLLDSGHPEASDARVPRTVYAQASWSLDR